MTPLERVRDALQQAGSRRSGPTGWTCPAHDDRQASLSVAEGQDGRVLITCHAGCQLEDILHELGLATTDLFLPRDQRDDRPVIVCTYDYTDEHGTLLFQVVRYLPKAFRQRRPLGGGWEYKLGDTRRVLYRLPAVVQAIEAGREVWIAEGEKDVHALEHAGVVATCNPMGAGKWRPDYTRTLAGGDITIVTDRDPAGHAHADTVARSLRAAGCTVRVVEPAAGNDAADHLARRSISDFVPYHPDEPTDQSSNGSTPSGPGPSTASDLGEIRPFPLVDLAELAREGIPPPELICNQLVYRGGLHSLAGPPDCGKSTILYFWAALLLAQGQRVVLLDEESGREQVTEKFLALGAEPHHLELLAYVEYPARAWDRADIAGLAALLDAQRPALVGFDSSAAFLAQAGRDENAAVDITAFYKDVLLTAARNYHTAVLILDHLGKDQAGGRYARGSGAKLANVDVAFMLDAEIPFSRNQSGVVKMTVTKDRRGYLHRHHKIHVTAEDGQMALEFSTADAPNEGELTKLSPAARKLLFTLRNAHGGPLSIRALGDEFARTYGHGLTRQTMSSELNTLAGRGLIEAFDTGSRGEKYWAAIAPEGSS